MKYDKKSLLLYAVTDRTWFGEKKLTTQVEDALKDGATFVQLREKQLDDATFLKEDQSDIKATAEKFCILSDKMVNA